MNKLVSHLLLPMFALCCVTLGTSDAENSSKSAASGTLETLIVAQGSVSLNLDLNRLNGVSGKAPQSETVRFEAMKDSFFPILVLNNELRGPTLGVIALTTKDSPSLPAQMREALSRLVLEKGDAEQPYDLVVRDGKTGFVYFNIEGHRYDYDAKTKSLRITGGRLLISDGFAKNMGRPADAGAVVGDISFAADMRVIETRQVRDGVEEGATLPVSASREAQSSGPDVIVGDLPQMSQVGSSGGFVGLGVATTSCNAGNVQLNWNAMPNTDHPVIPQNLYRMSGGTDNTERFEQVGQSWLKHAFTALQQNACGFGCASSGTGTRLGVGCSDPYSVSNNTSQGSLGSRTWVNPFTGAYPSTARDHTGHSHSSISHLVLVAASDLNTTTNVGASYFAEAQYVTPHEYAWCQSHPGECNMYNNVSYRRYNVTGTTSFSFSPNGATVQMQPAVNAWTGATVRKIEPQPGMDGQGFVAFKVSGPVNGMYHYEYAVNNQNLDRAIQSFSVPLGCAVVSNIGFHAPLNEAGSANDGTGGTGINNNPWTANQATDSLTWSSPTLAEDPNANALRWGTTFNFRFDSARPPVATNATIGFFKNGSPITVAVQAPDAPCAPLTFASAVSRKTHGVTDFDIPLPLSGEPGVECRSGDLTLVFTFSNNIVSGTTALSAGTAMVGTPSFSGNTMTVNLTGVADMQKVTVSLNNVTDEFAQTMPETAVSVNMLLGDTNGNKSVSVADIAQTKAFSGAALDPSNFRSDINVSGAINVGDIGQVKANSGHSVP